MIPWFCFWRITSGALFVRNWFTHQFIHSETQLDWRPSYRFIAMGLGGEDWNTWSSPTPGFGHQADMKSSSFFHSVNHCEGVEVEQLHHGWWFTVYPIIDLVTPGFHQDSSLVKLTTAIKGRLTLQDGPLESATHWALNHLLFSDWRLSSMTVWLHMEPSPCQGLSESWYYYLEKKTST